MGLPAAAPWRVASSRASLARSTAGGLSYAASFDLLLTGALFIGSLLLAVTHPWSHAYVGEAQYGDAAYWDFAGENWARGYIGSKAPDIRPGYSVFLGVIYALTGPDLRHAVFAQSLLFAAMVVMLYLTGKRLSGRLGGVIAALLLALNPYMWEWTATSTTEILGSFANTAALLFMVDLCRRPHRMTSAALFGVSIALANVVRVFTLFFVGPALLVILLLPRMKLGTRIRLAAVALAAFVATVAPALVYQYLSTGDPGLSSNSAAAVFAASDPKYTVWHPAIYEEVAALVRARGEAVSPQTMDAEFRRLTIENYLKYPAFQVRRIARDLIPYIMFEGEIERPDRYTFFRPFVLLATTAAGIVLALAAGGLRRPLRLAPPFALAIGLLLAALPALAVAQGLAILGSVVQAVRGRTSRALALLAVVLFWAVTGVLAVMTAGISGFLLHRLYTQVEPARCLLLAVATTSIASYAFPRGFATARMLNLNALTRRAPRLPAVTRGIVKLAAAAVVLVLSFGGARLVLANAVSPADRSVYAGPTSDELASLAQRLGLPGELRYVDGDTFAPTRVGRISGQLPTEPTAYAVPGQFTRFLWHIKDQERTVFWFVFADRPRPIALDLNLLTVEAAAQLTEAEFGNRLGLLVLLTTNAYFDDTGDVARQNVLGARAFVPWDAGRRRFDYESTVTFPLATRLYDHARFEAARKVGKVAEVGPMRVQLTDRLVRAVELQADAEGRTQEAMITYPGVWIPYGGALHAWVSVHPRLFDHADVAPAHLEVRVSTLDGDWVVHDEWLDPMDRSRQVYVSFEADLSPYGGRAADLSIRAWGSDNDARKPFVVLIGEPWIRMP